MLVRSYRGYARLVDQRLARGYLNSRGGIYAAPRNLRRGQKLTRDGLALALRRAGYVDVWQPSSGAALVVTAEKKSCGFAPVGTLIPQTDAEPLGQALSDPSV